MKNYLFIQVAGTSFPHCFPTELGLDQSKSQAVSMAGNTFQNSDWLSSFPSGENNPWHAFCSDHPKLSQSIPKCESEINSEAFPVAQLDIPKLYIFFFCKSAELNHMGTARPWQQDTSQRNGNGTIEFTVQK